MGRPVADSPKYEGDLFYIELPSVIPGEWSIHKVSTDVNSHQAHIDKMLESGNTHFRERKTSRN